MSETSPPAALPPAPPKTFWQKASGWIVAIAGVIIGISGAIKLYHAFVPSLPSCQADTTTAVLRNIFKQKNVEVSKLSDFKTVTDTSEEKTCEGHIETPSETATIYYRVYWQNKDVTVMITKVDAKPRQ